VLEGCAVDVLERVGLRTSGCAGEGGLYNSFANAGFSLTRVQVVPRGGWW
jgi:hypothetical protein